MGIEIYRGKPIFYSFGNLMMQNETLRPYPGVTHRAFRSRSSLHAVGLFRSCAPANGTKGHPASPEFWQSMMAFVVSKNGLCKQIELYPVDLGFGRPRAQRGRPLLADE